MATKVVSPTNGVFSPRGSMNNMKMKRGCSPRNAKKNQTDDLIRQANEALSPRDDEIALVEIDPSELQYCKKVGSGCTAEVFRGFWREQEVAIKQIDWNKSNMGRAEQRAFDREVAIMAQTDNPYLVRLLGIASAQRPLRVITEYCAGGCLFELLHNCDHVELAWPQQLKMCKDVAIAMDYLHKFTPQIIHRDLKSLNLLLLNPIVSEKDVPHVKVSDFGLARMKEIGNAEWGKMTIAAGTCHWMAPEVFTGNRYDEKVDIYSYSMILFEIICQEIPFEDEEPAGVQRLASVGIRPDLEAVPPDCPETLRELMITSWNADPKQRPPFDTIVALLHTVVV
mmetsp:Transcript_32283/g.57094  ORF Transcript_32283/g.57094 Transcript_32283/m.57094 type:complete len:339 (-) Transcript_32283:245-1261(-)